MLDWGSRHLGQSTTAEQWLEETPGRCQGQTWALGTLTKKTTTKASGKKYENWYFNCRCTDCHPKQHTQWIKVGKALTAEQFEITSAFKREKQSLEDVKTELGINVNV